MLKWIGWVFVGLMYMLGVFTLGGWLADKAVSWGQEDEVGEMIDLRVETYGNIYKTSHTRTTINILRDTTLSSQDKLDLIRRLDAKFKQDSLEYVNKFKD